METEQALQAARDTHQSVLVTLRSDGKPQLSNVLHYVGEDGVVRVSTTADRAKYANLRRHRIEARLEILAAVPGDDHDRDERAGCHRSATRW